MVLLFFVPKAPEKAPSVPEPPAYYLRETGGHVALYAVTESAPVAEYNIRPSLLPPADAQALQAGIPIATHAELQRILEDYGG
ncbi:MAG: hypothetical protein RSB47_02285 [Ruthenibacterium sp.]